MIKIILSMSTWKIKIRFSNWKIKPQKWIAGLLLSILSFLSSKEKFVLENSHASCGNIVIVRADVVSMSFLLLDERLSEWVCNTRRSYIKHYPPWTLKQLNQLLYHQVGSLCTLITAFFKFDRQESCFVDLAINQQYVSIYIYAFVFTNSHNYHL